MSNRILVYGLISGSLNIPKCIAYILYENIINTVYENKLIASKWFHILMHNAYASMQFYAAYW